MEITDIEQKKFSTRLMGLNPGEVEAFLGEMTEELRRLKAENENLKRDLQAQELELREHKEREKTIRNVLVAAQKNAEQTRANAEREARLIVSSRGEGGNILREGNERLIGWSGKFRNSNATASRSGPCAHAPGHVPAVPDESGEEKNGAACRKAAARPNRGRRAPDSQKSRSFLQRGRSEYVSSERFTKFLLRSTTLWHSAKSFRYSCVPEMQGPGAFDNDKRPHLRAVQARVRNPEDIRSCA